MLTLKLAEYFLLTQQVDAVAGNVRIFRTSICNVPRPLTTIAEKRKPFLRANSDGDVDPDCKPANATSIAGIKYNPFFVEGEV
jgi:hypothetical protein